MCSVLGLSERKRSANLGGVKEALSNDKVHLRGDTAGFLTSRGLVSLRKVFRSPPVISSSKMNLGMACRLTPIQRTMF